jgi:hypothetical protein
MHVSILSLSHYPAPPASAKPPLLAAGIGPSCESERAYLFTCQLRLHPCSLSETYLTLHPTPCVLKCQQTLYHSTHNLDRIQRHDTTYHDQVFYPLITTTTSIQFSLRQRDLYLIKYRRNRHYSTYERRVCLRSSTGILADHNSVINDTTYTIHSTTFLLPNTPPRSPP